MAHPGRARVNAISTALPDSQLRLGVVVVVERGREETETVRLVSVRKEGS